MMLRPRTTSALEMPNTRSGSSKRPSKETLPDEAPPASNQPAEEEKENELEATRRQNMARNEAALRSAGLLQAQEELAREAQERERIIREKRAREEEKLLAAPGEERRSGRTHSAAPSDVWEQYADDLGLPEETREEAGGDDQDNVGGDGQYVPTLSELAAAAAEANQDDQPGNQTASLHIANSSDAISIKLQKLTKILSQEPMSFQRQDAGR